MPFSVAFAPLNARSVELINPMAPPAVVLIRCSPRLLLAGSLKRPTSQEAAMNSGSRAALVSASASVEISTLSSASLNGLPWPI